MVLLRAARARRAGAERVMLGSDAPFPIGDPEPVKVIRNPDFTEAQKGGMLSQTAQQVFRIRSDSQARS
jgi:aminocarboxymuconate-semialdehyde decarboxylase